MKVLAIESSSRPDGLTATMTEAALAGARDAGAETELVALRDHQLECCRQCDERGWGGCRSDGVCVIPDDFGRLVEKVLEADALILATPVYYGDLSEKAKVFTDRLRRLSSGRGGKYLGNLRTLGIAAAGGSGGGTPSCLAAIEKVLTVPGCFVVDLIPVARRNAAYKAETCRLAGRGLVEGAGEDQP